MVEVLLKGQGTKQTICDNCEGVIILDVPTS
jgi:hypothetical protein